MSFTPLKWWSFPQINTYFHNYELFLKYSVQDYKCAQVLIPSTISVNNTVE